MNTATATSKTARVNSTALVGFSGQKIEIECDLTNSLPTMVIVGLGTKAVDEAKDRVRSAITNSGLNMPRKRITVNLAPADIKKEGSSYDLPIAVAILLASRQITDEMVGTASFIGELGLDGRVRPVFGIISHLLCARAKGIKQVYIPEQNTEQAGLIDGLELIPVSNLKQLYLHFTEVAPLQPMPSSTDRLRKLPRPLVDFNDVYGQTVAKRALEIAAAGGHNILMNGPPGAGKTLLARALAGILPPLSREEMITSTNLFSLAGLTTNEVVQTRPFRAPHHSASQVALTGGGQQAGPGEISLAHNGVLFLDELPEFPRHVLESLRQPLEDKQVSVIRAQRKATYPADFTLVATQNPCPCGYLEDPTRECTCSPHQVIQYNKKVSGPLLDRVDLVINVARVEAGDMLRGGGGDSSAVVLTRVLSARQRQNLRFGRTKTNSLMSNKDIKRHAKLNDDAQQLLEQAAERLPLSGRGYMRTIKVSRTIADLAASDTIEQSHMAEALQYRHRSVNS